MAGFPFIKQAEPFRGSFPFVLLPTVLLLPWPLTTAAPPPAPHRTLKGEKGSFSLRIPFLPTFFFFQYLYFYLTLLY